MKKLLMIMTVSLALAQPLSGGIIVNEALVNEPGGTVKAEWIELYNSDSNGVLLDDYTLTINGAIHTFPAGVYLDSAEYLVLARDSLTFELFWGDQSGVWGDDPALEGYSIMIIPLQLVNSSGFARIVSATGDSSALDWSGAGSDGVSWERANPDNAVAGASKAIAGSTPGERNSLTPHMFDLAVVGLDFAKSEAGSALCVSIGNHGNRPSEPAWLLMLIDPYLDSAMSPQLQGESITRIGIPALRPDEVVVRCEDYLVAGDYVTLGVVIDTVDENSSNDFLVGVFPGGSYPAIIANEFLANPQANGPSEWVELVNRSDSTIDLDSWRIGDLLNQSMIDSGIVILNPSELVVFAQDRNAFLDFYSGFDGVVVELSPWRALNNSGDVVKLIDHLGYTSDSIRYDGVWNNNVTWARLWNGSTAGEWGRSVVFGGSPGANNEAVLSPEGSEIVLSITPNPFSPDSDGFEDVAQISVTGIVGAEMQILIYTSDGSLTRTLFYGEPFNGEILWDGKTGNGGRAPIGIYIVYVEIDGSSAKTTVVVAR